MAEREQPPAQSLAARVLGGGARGARVVAEATGIDDVVDLAAEQAIVTALESPGVERALVRVLEGPAAEEALERLLKSPAVERALTEALDSELVDRLWERLLASDEAQRLVERIAEAPEVRAAVASQGIGLIEDLGRRIRDLANHLDTAAESLVRRLTRRAPRSGPTKRAGLVTRGLALATDAMILNATFLATIAGIGLAIDTFDGGGADLPVVLGGIGWILGGSAYILFFWTLGGRTPGMRFLNIRLYDGDGTPELSFRTAVRRLFGVAVSILPLGAGLFAVLLSDRRRGWHDRIAGTEVMLDEEREAPHSHAG